MIDAVVRLLPGALGDAESAQQDSFMHGLLDHPHYTRPQLLAGRAVPPVLLGGDHARVARWRMQQALARTWRRRLAEAWPGGEVFVYFNNDPGGAAVYDARAFRRLVNR